MAKIKVHEKALAHLSRGLYRSPASALRELVSNAWDANATLVRIDTNYPNFFQISVEDNGDGFTESDFVHLMKGGIGNSQKRPRGEALKHGRPIIGRLGIGLLGIAQICGSFTISSRTKEGKTFSANVRLYDLLKEKLDRDDNQVISYESNELISEVDVGEYDLVPNAPKLSKPGTKLVATDVHPTFTRSFAESLTYEKFIQPSLDWKQSIKAIEKIHSLQELGDYWRLLWELAVSCPLQYIDDKALPQHLIQDEQKRLESFKFNLVVDGISLRKPVYLKNNVGGYSTWPIPETSQQVYGRQLKFHGYILVQDGSQLKPDELRGILIRIKNVSIGYYDSSLLDYRYNEGPRAKWVTGEIYVDVGLENALNIDRDSFNRFHPEFRVIQKFVHNLLQTSVFPESYKQIEKRSVQKKLKLVAEREEHLRNVISAHSPTKANVKIEKQKSSDIEKVAVTRSSRSLSIHMPAQLATKKTSQQLAQSILAIFELSMREKTTELKREVFTDLLLGLLKKW